MIAIRVPGSGRAGGDAPFYFSMDTSVSLLDGRRAGGPYINIYGPSDPAGLLELLGRWIQPANVLRLIGHLLRVGVPVVPGRIPPPGAIKRAARPLIRFDGKSKSRLR
jgi:hypothetical protein